MSWHRTSAGDWHYFDSQTGKTLCGAQLSPLPQNEAKRVHHVAHDCEACRELIFAYWFENGRIPTEPHVMRKRGGRKPRGK